MIMDMTEKSKFGKIYHVPTYFVDAMERHDNLYRGKEIDVSTFNFLG